ncbi:MAG TPA: hypothetical protein VKZ53_02810 [Candidatus Angelobacter sp.]|nr:hypothetical protein [Candidatus Angelobacter sp.]
MAANQVATAVHAALVLAMQSMSPTSLDDKIPSSGPRNPSPRVCSTPERPVAESAPYPPVVSLKDRMLRIRSTRTTERRIGEEVVGYFGA